MYSHADAPRQHEPQYDVELLGISKMYGAATAAVQNISLRVERGTFLSLLGPSGCGKTTTLRLIAGFEQPTTGRVLIRGQDVAGLPPYRRDVNTVFQSYALFPHMSVAENIGYALRQRHVGRDEIRHRVEEALEMVRLPGAGARRPAQLSGGQQQRVALARALVNRPTVLLLDEPLSALDLKLRKEMQIELKALQHEVGITFIYVTHDQEEAITLSNRIVVMNGGRLEQEGSPTEVYERPRTRFVADFIGLTNFIAGQVREVTLASPSDGMSRVVVTTDCGDICCASAESDSRVGTSVTIALRPEKISLLDASATPHEGWNAVQGVVTHATFLGAQNEYQVRIDPQRESGQGQLITVRQQNLGALADLSTNGDLDIVMTDGWRAFGPGERVTLTWRHEASLVLSDAGNGATTRDSMSAQAPTPHASRS
jgi:spermidine/putrescine transport system ATP-binding protein